jgi:PleD family two-component response regulator/EAL domain-containing protein (putative c-di-GMP-specific phosphodiesterase class I)
MSDQPIRILVVDDDFATRLLASEALLADGFASFEAADGREALEQYDRTQPDAVLLDVHMPELDGYEVCRRIRRRPGGAATSIMVMTANDDVDAVQCAFAAGATDFLTKPLNLPLLAHRVRYMLRAAAAATAARDAAARQARAQRLARLVHWQLGADDQFLWASDPFAVFWPDAPTDPRAPDSLLAIVHPDDRERVAAVLGARASHQLDFRLLLPDGSERVVHQDAEVEFTERGVVLIGATQDITEAKRTEQQIAQLAFYDDLTGIPNRQFVERHLRRLEPGAPRAAIAVELGTGHLDRLSATARDALIRAATARVIERVRGADLDVRLDQVPRTVESFAGATLVARTGDDELLVVASELAPGTAAAVARRIADALAQPFAIAGHELALRPRFGVVEHPDPADELRRIAELAHDAMLDAERTAPRDIRVFTASARERKARRQDLAYQLALALDAVASEPHPALAVEYAPRVEPVGRRVIGVRASARWAPAEGDPQTLAEALAGDPTLRDRLAGWTLDASCRDAARWLATGLRRRIAVELPCSHLAAPAFARTLDRLVADARFELGLLDLEVVDLPADPEELDRIAGALGAIRGRGARIVLARLGDDCALGALRRMPLDALHVDRTTIERLGPTFLSTVAAIARALGLRLAIAEIDSPAALAALDPHVPHELAGALFGGPVPAQGVPGLTTPVMPADHEPRGAPLESTRAP